MGFFGFIETFFFISLAITFVLIMLLVYHFKQRLSDVEAKTDTMFEIMNNLLKEMKTIKTMVIETQQQQSIPLRQPIYEEQGQPGNMFEMMMPFLQGASMGQFQQYENDDENENEAVSPIKIINLDTEMNNEIDIDDIESIGSEESEEEEEEEEEAEPVVEKPLEIIDYKSLDIVQLRALAIEKGIDPSKKKKAELIQLLQ
jgi:hypothetical protein